jgi:peptidoglycan/LPS O-acetylase OafA/YrhL
MLCVEHRREQGLFAVVYRYRYFGAFRLLLATMVVVQHAVMPFGDLNLQTWLAPLEAGSIAVLLFFVLSGFIISEAAAVLYDRRPVAFALNRIIRIYPPYLIATVLTLIVIAAVEYAGGRDALAVVFAKPVEFSGMSLVSNALAIFPFVHKVPSLSETVPVLGLAWALRIELFFYAVVAIGLAIAAFIEQRIVRVLGAFAVGFLLFYLQRFDSLRGTGLEFTPYFVLGASVYFAIEPGRVRRRAFAGLLAIISTAMIAAHISGQAPLNEAAGYVRNINGQLAVFFMGLSAWLLLIAAPLSAQRFPEWLLSTDQRLGELTYPLYLTHMVAIIPCVWLLARPSPLAIVLVVALALGLAAVVNWGVEAPLSKLRRRIREANKGVPGTVMGRP